MLGGVGAGDGNVPGYPISVGLLDLPTDQAKTFNVYKMFIT